MRYVLPTKLLVFKLWHGSYCVGDVRKVNYTHSKMLVWPWTCIGHMLTNGKVLFQRIIGHVLSRQVLFLVATCRKRKV